MMLLNIVGFVVFIQFAGQVLNDTHRVIDVGIVNESVLDALINQLPAAKTGRNQSDNATEFLFNR
jgi:hypothetical protein